MLYFFGPSVQFNLFGPCLPISTFHQGLLWTKVLIFFFFNTFEFKPPVSLMYTHPLT